MRLKDIKPGDKIVVQFDGTTSAIYEVKRGVRGLYCDHYGQPVWLYAYPKNVDGHLRGVYKRGRE